jgi:hypothetical protein
LCINSHNYKVMNWSSLHLLHLSARTILSVVIKGFCSAATGLPRGWNTCNKSRQINELSD